MQAQLVEAQRLLAERRFVEAARVCEQLLVVAGRENDRELEDLLGLARGGATPAGLGPGGLFRLAVTLQRAQLYPEAAREYRELLKLMPDAAEVHNNLGSVLQALGETDAAVASFEQALQLKPDYARALANLGGLWVVAGRAAEARRVLKRAAELRPDDAAAWINLGTAARAQGALEQAVDAYRRAIALRPGDSTAHLNLANALAEDGNAEDALAACAEACRLDPRGAAPCVLRAVLLTRLGRTEEAAAVLDTLPLAEPARPDIAIRLCQQLGPLGRTEAAADLATRALERAPSHAALRLEAARIHVALRRFGAARALIEPLLTESAGATVWSEAGHLLLYDGAERSDGACIEAAIGMFERALAADPGRLADRLALALALVDCGRGAEAAGQLEAVLAAEPQNGRAAAALLDIRAAACDWTDHERLLSVIRAAIEAGAEMSPLIATFRFDDPGLIQRAARRYIASTGFKVAARRSASPRRRLRIGYLSQDFHVHPVAFAIAPVLECHDRSRVEVVGIGTADDDGSAIASRIRAACDRFTSVALLDAQSVDARLRDLELDVLVDLGGLTIGGRPRVLAARPAPVQVSYLGYPATTGAPWTDYLLADRFVVPAESRGFYDEQVVWLPDTFLAGERSAADPATRPTRADAGLPDQAFVYCNFNQPERIGPAAFDVFIGILGRAPQAVLWMRDPGRQGAGRLRRRAAAAGLAPDRIVFAQRVESRAEHLARLGLADLFLDTLPYNAHTTAREALAASVPVLTCAGASFAARVAGSLLTSLGVPELIAGSIREFADRAVGLAGDPAPLTALRARIAAASERSAAFNPLRQARQLEAAYAAVYGRASAGLPPGPVTVDGA